MERIKSFAKNADSFLTKSNISKKSLILWFMLLVLFITAAVFVYINYIKPQLDVMDYKANYEFNNTNYLSIGKFGRIFLFRQKNKIARGN